VFVGLPTQSLFLFSVFLFSFPSFRFEELFMGKRCFLKIVLFLKGLYNSKTGSGEGKMENREKRMKEKMNE